MLQSRPERIGFGISVFDDDGFKMKSCRVLERDIRITSDNLLVGFDYTTNFKHDKVISISDIFKIVRRLSITGCAMHSFYNGKVPKFIGDVRADNVIIGCADEYARAIKQSAGHIRDSCFIKYSDDKTLIWTFNARFGIVWRTIACHFQYDDDVYDHRGKGIYQYFSKKTNEDIAKRIYSFLSPCCSKSYPEVLTNDSKLIPHVFTDSGLHHSKIGWNRNIGSFSLPCYKDSDLFDAIRDDYNIQNINAIRFIWKHDRVSKNVVNKTFNMDLRRYQVEAVKNIRQMMEGRDKVYSKAMLDKKDFYTRMLKEGKAREIAEIYKKNKSEIGELNFNSSILEDPEPPVVYRVESFFFGRFEDDFFISYSENIEKLKRQNFLSNLRIWAKDFWLNKIPKVYNHIQNRDVRWEAASSVRDSYEKSLSAPKRYHDLIPLTNTRCYRLLSRHTIDMIGSARRKIKKRRKKIKVTEVGEVNKLEAFKRIRAVYNNLNPREITPMKTYLFEYLLKDMGIFFPLVNEKYWLNTSIYQKETYVSTNRFFETFERFKYERMRRDLKEEVVETYVSELFQDQSDY
jgi:hypothetical protein